MFHLIKLALEIGVPSYFSYRLGRMRGKKKKGGFVKAMNAFLEAKGF